MLPLVRSHDQEGKRLAIDGAILIFSRTVSFSIEGDLLDVHRVRNPIKGKVTRIENTGAVGR